MTCHQAHNIPWQNLVDCYGLDQKLQDKHMGEKSEGYAEFVTPLKKKLSHFIKCFAKTVEEFAATERKKISDKELAAIDKSQLLYSDEEADAVAQFKQSQDVLPKGDFQRIDHWLALQESGDLARSVTAAQTMKYFIGKGNLVPLMRLIKAKVDLSKIQFMTYSNFFHYGARRILEDSLQLYIQLNLATAFGKVATSSIEGYHPELARFIRGEIMSTSDWDTQLEIFFRPYFDRKTGVFLGDTAEQRADQAKKLIHECFRMIYQYVMIVREADCPRDIEQELLSYCNLMFSRLIEWDEVSEKLVIK